MTIDYTRLLKSLEWTFVNQHKFLFDKYVPEFKENGKFLGDCFVQTVVEPSGNKPPRFYHNFSPFDVISNKAPEQALVFENGNLLLDVDFTHGVVLRTAAMNTLLLKSLGIQSLRGMRVLLFGAGRIATETVKILASQLDLSKADVISKSGDLTKIKEATEKCNVNIHTGNLENISDYDVIICHTQSAEPVIREEHITRIKHGATLTSFISSTDHGEFPDSIYNNHQANIIVDWEKTITSAKDMQRAKEEKLFEGKDIIFVRDLLISSRSIDTSKPYTIYRSVGTPLQNLAVLKELL